MTQFSSSQYVRYKYTFLGNSKMRPDVKRSTLVLGLLAFVVVLVIFFSRVILPESVSTKDPKTQRPSSSSWTVPPRPTYIRPNTTHFQWINVPIRHPVSSFAQLPTGRPSALPKIQHSFGPEPQAATEIRTKRQSAVKIVFERCWKSYKKHAWLKDELAPISGGSKNTFGGWAATLIDSLDTLWMLGMHEDFEEAVQAASNINFGPDTSNLQEINIFETTIRHLGGFIAAYDLTEGKDKRLLDKAVELGDMIYASFDTPNRMPITRWSPRRAANGEEQQAASNGILAEMGSSSLELTRLSQLTGDMRWFDAIQRITDVFDEQQSKTKIPGMWPVGINVQAPDLTYDSSFALGAMADSAYEYLPKMYALLGGLQPAHQYRRLYNFAMESAITATFYRPMTPDNADIVLPGKALANGFRPPYTISKESEGEHLACFVGGMLALGGRLVENKTHVDLGEKVTDGCVWAYRNSAIGIMPEVFHMPSCPSFSGCEWIEAQGGSPAGFTSIDDHRYILRPEAIESVFYLYRITGDQKFQEAAWDMFQAIERHTHTDLANAALSDMTITSGPPKADSMESFWLAETLKYFYLIFGEPSLISLDDYVFNTEAHPFRIPK